ncbi:MAG: GYF domain-containing protein [Verrucomicrobiota bacterium]|nr:GYF domain-containing protein [Verrucomicrobiota bacterium]
MDYIVVDMDSIKWFYLLEGQQRGPMNTRNLQELLESEAIPSTTLVWTASQPDWQPASSTTLFPRRNLKGNSYIRKTMMTCVFIVCLGIRGQHAHDLSNSVPQSAWLYIGKTVYDAQKKMTTGVPPPIRDTIITKANSKRTIEQPKPSRTICSKVKIGYPPPDLHTGNQRTINGLDVSETIETHKESKRMSLQGVNLKKNLKQRKQNSNKAEPTVLKGHTTEKKKPSRLLGHVSNVDHKFKRIVITAGSKHGITVGEKFRIISRKDGDPLGQLSIQQVLPSMSTAIFEGNDFNSLKLGDQILR